MNGLTLDLPWPPSMNHYWRTVRIGKSNRTLISAKGKAYRQAVLEAVHAQHPRTGAPSDAPLIVEIDAHPPDARRRDLDNLLKAPLDALTHAGVWADDSLIRDLRIAFRPAVRPAGILRVTIMDLEA